MFAPTAQASAFAKALANRVEKLPVGLPWQTFDGSLSKITPLPNQKRIEYMKELLDDATSKGAEIINKGGGTIVGGPESTLMVPAVLYPVTPDMKIYKEEQVSAERMDWQPKVFHSIIRLTFHNSRSSVRWFRSRLTTTLKLL